MELVAKKGAIIRYAPGSSAELFLRQEAARQLVGVVAETYFEDNVLTIEFTVGGNEVSLACEINSPALMGSDQSVTGPAVKSIELRGAEIDGVEASEIVSCETDPYL